MAEAAEAAEAVDVDKKEEENKENKENKNVPAAEEEKEEKEPKEEKKGDNEDDNKDDEKAWKPPRIPKPEPGDGLPENKTDVIEFKWNKDMTQKKLCDTQHMLYLLQLSLEKVRLRTIERNKYFKSIGRTDRYINQLDAPRVITNFLNWHNKDKEKNKFDGSLLEKSEKLFMINEMISEIGDVKKGPATKIYMKLTKDVVIETTTWLELPQPKLELHTWGYTKMYKDEKVINECSVEEMIKLLQNGVFQSVIDANAAKNKPSALEKVENWQDKIVEYFRKQSMDGAKFMTAPVKETCKEIMDYLEKGNNKLRGGVNQVIRGLKKCYVHELLSK